MMDEAVFSACGGESTRTKLDDIASIAAFEKSLQTKPARRIRVFEQYNHWFLEQYSEVALLEIRSFRT